MESERGSLVISRRSLARMPYYVRCLTDLREKGVERVCAPMLAGELGVGEVQVRKDLSAVSTSGGKPKAGFSVDELLENMKNFLGYNNVSDAVLVGAGSLGRALMSYQGFTQYGLNILAAFDDDLSKTGREIAGKPVFPMNKLSNLIGRLNVRIGILAVPEEAAQSVCNQLVEAGIQALWNFAPIRLDAPEHILIQNQNMAISLAILSKHLRERKAKE